MAQKGQLTTADYLSIEEFKSLLDGLHKDKRYIWELYCRVSFYTALRASDVRTLIWNDIINKDELIKTEKKTLKNRRITFNRNAKDTIRNLYKLLGSPDKNSPILCNLVTRLPYSIEHINRKLKEFKFDYHLPIKQFSTHTFRKTFGRYVYESNNKSAESLILLNSIFKHSSINTTKVYIGIQQNEIDKVFESITI